MECFLPDLELRLEWLGGPPGGWLGGPLLWAGDAKVSSLASAAVLASAEDLAVSACAGFRLLSDTSPSVSSAGPSGWSGASWASDESSRELATGDAGPKKRRPWSSLRRRLA